MKSLKQLLVAVIVYLSFQKLTKFQLIENEKGTSDYKIIKGVFNEMTQILNKVKVTFLVPSTG